MTTFFITRHPATNQWAKEKGFNIDVWLEHLDNNTLDNLKKGDTVLGILPINIIHTLNTKGVQYGHFAINVPFELRGKELTPEQIKELNPTITFYHVEEIKTL